MNITKSIATLQLLGTTIRKINLENNFVIFSDSDKVEKQIDLNCKFGNINKDDDAFWGSSILDLSIDIRNHEDNEDRSLVIKLELEGCFSYQGDDEDEFKELLEINGSASLYSIARSIITMFTSQAFDGDKVILPMLNFFDLVNDSKQE